MILWLLAPSMYRQLLDAAELGHHVLVGEILSDSKHCSFIDCVDEVRHLGAWALRAQCGTPIALRSCDSFPSD